MHRLLKVLSILALFLALPVVAQTSTPNPDTILSDCVASLSPDRPMPTGADAPSIRIVSPASGTVVRGARVPNIQATMIDVLFQVETVNFDVTRPGLGVENAQHWHMWLNGGVWGMFYDTTTMVSIPVGTWRVCATLGDATHMDIGMPAAILLTVEEAGAGTPAATVLPDLPRPVPETNSPSTPRTLLLALAAGIVVLGGWWLGKRTGRRRS